MLHKKYYIKYSSSKNLLGSSLDQCSTGKNPLNSYMGTLLICALTSFLFILSCSQNDKSNEIVLARIQDKEITLTDFNQRSGLTLRPSPFKRKDITLNNLICEKIFAIEGENDEKIVNDKRIQSTVLGIKEQLMRDKLYDQEIEKKVQIDSTTAINTFVASMREYNVEFYTIFNKQVAEGIKTQLDSIPESTDTILKSLQSYLGKKPQHTVRYDDADDEVIFEALYSKKLDIGTVVGPKRLSNGSYILMKVTDWVDKPPIGAVDQKERWRKVSEKLHKIESDKLWDKYVRKTMAGKKLEFEEKPFNVLSRWAMERHVANVKNNSLPDSLQVEMEYKEPEVNDEEPFFTVDNNTWTVGEFKEAIASHPLVYRTKYLDEKNFAGQFKYAVVDLIRDHYLTQEAYKQNLDEDSYVNKQTEIWKDAIIASRFKKDILTKAKENGLYDTQKKNGLKVYFESVITDFQSKYADDIEINYEELNKIKLDKVDFYAFRSGVPYPAPVPNFPLYMSSGKLDYTSNRE